MAYRADLGDEPVVIEFDHAKVDWADVCNATSKRMFPGIELEPDWKVDLRLGVGHG